MRIPEIVEMLKQLGLGHDEASVYATLRFLGPCRAGALATAASLSRPQTYRALESLTSRGVVTSDLSRPKIFTPVAIERLLHHLRTQVETQAQELKLLEPALRSALGGPPPDGARQPSGRADILRTRAVVIARAHEMFEGAQERIDAVFTHPAGLNLVKATGGWALLMRRAREGVAVRLLVRAVASNEALLREAKSEPNLQIREVDVDDLLACVVVDDAEVLSAMVVDPASFPRADKTTSIATDASNFVRLHRTLVGLLWDSAETVTELKGLGAPESLGPGRLDPAQGRLRSP